jgi:hypothetical protein
MQDNILQGLETSAIVVLILNTGIIDFRDIIVSGRVGNAARAGVTLLGPLKSYLVPKTHEARW